MEKDFFLGWGMSNLKSTRNEIFCHTIYRMIFNGDTCTSIPLDFFPLIAQAAYIPGEWRVLLSSWN